MNFDLKIVPFCGCFALGLNLSLFGHLGRCVITPGRSNCMNVSCCENWLVLGFRLESKPQAFSFSLFLSFPLSIVKMSSAGVNTLIRVPRETLL